ncbi:hypothetical protein MCHLDSM_00287 [Mycolicibacterium chlorophenolicum]|uniref:Uncharacterized protein n=1 Tax=Mycolicibacterium chlorophenolicum TaxID=37916 RepID=A0A0J6WJZ0_9MYCO|nr:hypothetical protein MCHLDSM_00287 [Mycolicibacterium chlorophenolicum]
MHTHHLNATSDVSLQPYSNQCTYSIGTGINADAAPRRRRRTAIHTRYVDPVNPAAAELNKDAGNAFGNMCTRRKSHQDDRPTWRMTNGGQSRSHFECQLCPYRCPEYG